MKNFFIVLLLTFLNVQEYQAQTTDTLLLDSVPLHSPTKATILSLALPGAGQVYNKKYWKVPLVYAAIGTPLYFALQKQNEFNEFKKAYAARVDNDSTTMDTKYVGIYSNQNLLRLVELRRKDRDLFFVLTGLAYVLNVVDAAVDAHLFYFDVTDDLGARIQPHFQYLTREQKVIPAITLTFNIKSKTHINTF